MVSKLIFTCMCALLRGLMCVIYIAEIHNIAFLLQSPPAYWCHCLTEQKIDLSVVDMIIW